MPGDGVEQLTIHPFQYGLRRSGPSFEKQEHEEHFGGVLGPFIMDDIYPGREQETEIIF